MSVISLWQNRGTLGDGHRARELAAFLPAALEIQNTPPHPLARWLAWSLLALFVIGVVWACFGELNVVATAEGKIIPTSRVKAIQPLEKGIVRAILVKEGDYVEAGQPLVELDSTVTQADQNRLTKELDSVQTAMAISEALLALLNPEKATAAPASMAELSLDLSHLQVGGNALVPKQLLWQRWQQYSAQVKVLGAQHERNAAEQASAQAVIQKLTQTVPLITERAEQMGEMVSRNFAAKTEYLVLEQERISQTQDLLAEQERLKQLVAEARQIAEQREVLLAETQSAVLSELNEQQRQANGLREELAKAEAMNNKQVLVAPVAGRIQDLAISTIGGVVTDAQQLMTVVPQDERLSVEVFLENKDIGFVQEGMAAEIKIHTFPFTKYGVVEGEVLTVSNDAVVDEQRGLIYRMQVEMDKRTMAVNGREVNLMPGMAVTAEVKTGKRRIVEYFMAPLMVYKDEALRER